MSCLPIPSSSPGRVHFHFHFRRVQVTPVFLTNKSAVGFISDCFNLEADDVLHVVPRQQDQQAHPLGVHLAHLHLGRHDPRAYRAALRAAGVPRRSALQRVHGQELLALHGLVHRARRLVRKYKLPHIIYGVDFLACCANELRLCV